MTRLPTRNPNSLKSLQSVREAIRWKNVGQTSEAERHFVQALKADPESFDALLHFGLLKYERGELQGSYELLERAAALYPQSVELLNTLGSVLFRLKRDNE